MHQNINSDLWWKEGEEFCVIFILFLIFSASFQWRSAFIIIEKFY